jgi:hypothetical protein
MNNLLLFFGLPCNPTESLEDVWRSSRPLFAEALCSFGLSSKVTVLVIAARGLDVDGLKKTIMVMDGQQFCQTD